MGLTVRSDFMIYLNHPKPKTGFEFICVVVERPPPMHTRLSKVQLLGTKHTGSEIRNLAGQRGHDLRSRAATWQGMGLCDLKLYPTLRDSPTFSA